MNINAAIAEEALMVLTLYGGQRTRASLPRWYMEEKAITYNLIELNRQESENLQADEYCNAKRGTAQAL